MVYSKLHNFITFSFLLLNTFAYEYLGCYSSLPSGFLLKDTSSDQSSTNCDSVCASNHYKYFALANHESCYCSIQLNDLDVESLSDSCDTLCSGNKQEAYCGNSSFSIYEIDNIDNVLPLKKAVDTEDDSDATSDDDDSTDVVVVVRSTVEQETETKYNTVEASITDTSPDTTANGESTKPTAGSTFSQRTSRRRSRTTDRTPVISTTVVYSTTFSTEGGSTLFITNTITRSAQATQTVIANNNGTLANGKSTKKKHVNVGAIVGGVVGGVCGALVVSIIALFGIRTWNKRREQERMELEYQEAIKPVGTNKAPVESSPQPYVAPTINNNKETFLYNTSSISSHNDSSLPNRVSSSSFEPAPPARINPFEDNRRISNGSILEDQRKDNQHILTVVNPDED